MLLSNKVLASIILILFAFTSQAVLAKKLRMVTVDWSPYYSSSLESGGVVTELVQAAFQRAGYESDIKWLPWLRALRAVEYGAADLVMGAYYSKERAEVYSFSEPVFSVDVGLIALESLGIKEYTTLDSLKSQDFGVMRGWVYTEEFDNADYLKKHVFVNQVSAVRMLYSKKVDILAASINVFKHEASLIGMDIDKEVVVLSPLLDSKPLYLMFSKSIPNYLELTQNFNEGLASIRADGTFQKILNKHSFH